MRVTIGQLTEDFIPHTEQGNKALNIEIIPRKITEDAVDYCNEILSTDPRKTVLDEVRKIRDYIELMVKTFEEGVTDGSHNE